MPHFSEEHARDGEHGDAACLSSASRYLTISAGDARSAKPSGSKSKRELGTPGIWLPGRP